jgi:hypothetical protein
MLYFFWLLPNFTSVLLKKKQKCVPRSSSFLSSTGIFVEWKNMIFYFLFSVYFLKSSFVVYFDIVCLSKESVTYIFFVEIQCTNTFYFRFSLEALYTIFHFTHTFVQKEILKTEFEKKLEKRNVLTRTYARLALI